MWPGAVSEVFVAVTDQIAAYYDQLADQHGHSPAAVDASRSDAGLALRRLLGAIPGIPD